MEDIKQITSEERLCLTIMIVCNLCIFARTQVFA